jgi:hypothetical protein
MVQIIERGPSLSSLSGQILGQSLGQGLGQFVGDYRANQAFEKVTNDPELKNKSLSERWNALSQVARKHGLRGENFLKNQLQLEQQAEQEKTQKRESKLVQKLLNGEEISDTELEGTRPELQIMAHKARQPKAPPGGLSGQPVPPEISQKIPEILNSNKDRSAEELATSFDAAGIPRTYSNSYIESRRRQEETQAKTGQKGSELERTYQTQRAAPILKKYDEIAANLPFKESALNTIEQNMTDTGISDFIADATGFEPLRSASASRAKTGLKEYLLSNLVRAGARPNQWIEQQINSALPNFGRNAEANESVTRILRNQFDLEKSKTDLIFDLAKKDREEYGYEHGDLEERANKELKPIIEKLNDNLSFDLRKIYEKNKSDSELLKVKEVPKGTPLTVKMASLLINKYNGDRAKAEKEAKMRGFTVMPDEFYMGQEQ